MVEVPRLKFVPANLLEMLEAQVGRLTEVGVPGEVGVDGAEFLDYAMKMAGEFIFSPYLFGELKSRKNGTKFIRIDSW